MQKQLINKECKEKYKPKKPIKHRHHESRSSMQLPFLVEKKKEENKKEDLNQPHNCENQKDESIIQCSNMIKSDSQLQLQSQSHLEPEMKMKDTLDQDIKLLSLLKREYEREKETTLLQFGNIYPEYNQKKVEIRKMAKDNKVLYEQLKDIQNEPNTRIKLSKLFKVKHYHLNQNISNIKEKIKRQTIDLNQLTKVIEENKTEKEIMKNLCQQLNNNEENTIIPNLTNELKMINDKANELNEVIQQLHKISVMHKNCERNNKNLSTTIALLTKQYENDKVMYSYYKTDKKDLLIKNNSDCSFNSINSSFASLNINNNRMPINLIRVRFGSPKGKKIPYYLSSIKKNAQYIEKLKKKNISKSMPMIDPYISKRKDLFDKEEKSVLIQWIPSKKISDYEMRYNNIQEKKREIEQKLLLISESQKSEIRLKKDKNEENIKSLQDQKKETAQLQNDYCLVKKKVLHMKNKIQNTQALIQKTSQEIIQKESDYHILINHYNMVIKKLNISKK